MIKDIKKRIKEFSEVIKRNPEVKELYIERAKLYYEIKNYKKAVEDYKKAYPGYFGYGDMISVCEKAGLIQEAETLYTKAINADKNNADNYIKRIYFYMRTGEIEKAISDCNIVLKLSPKEETISLLKRILTAKSHPSYWIIR